MALVLVFGLMAAALTAGHTLLVCHPSPRGGLDGMRRDLTRSLGRLQTGKGLMAVLVALAGILLWVQLFPSLSPTFSALTATLILGPLLILLTDLIPRAWAKRFPTRAESTLARILPPLHRVLMPMTAPASQMMKALMPPPPQESGARLNEDESMLQEDEREMIEGVLDFGETVAEDIMTPRSELQTISQASTREEVEEVFRNSAIRRLLVHGETPDQVLGFLHLRDFILDSDRPWTELLREPLTIHPDMKIGALLERIRESQIFIAVVVDEFGGIEGVVTIKNIYQAIVGEIREHGEPKQDDRSIKPVRRIRENVWRAWGRIEVEDLNVDLPIPLPIETARTLSGLLVNSLGHIPEVGDEMTIEPWHLRVNAMAGPRVEEIELTLRPAEDDE